MKIFSMDSAFYRFISRLGDLMIVNILFLIGCLGIVTIGPSLAAMYTMLLKFIRNESGYVVREFWKAFRDNFKQSFILWCICMAVGVLLYYDVILSNYIGGTIAQSLKIIFLFFGILYFSVVSYLFVVQSRFENTLWNTVKNSFWMAVGYLPFTVSILVVEFIPLFIILVKPQMFWYLFPVMLTLGFAGLGYICAAIFDHIFKNYIPEEKKQ